MKICIIGDGLTSLSLAKNLVNKKLNVHIYRYKKSNNLLSSRTIGIAKSNLEFFEKEIQKIPKKKIWQINKIEIYSEDVKNNKILNFKNEKDNLFYMVKHNVVYKILNDSLLKNKFFKRKLIKKNFSEGLLKKKKYDLIINCDQNNLLSQKYFMKKINKDYKNIAYTTILEHEKIKNNSAIQVFTSSGPVAYLPISDSKTSIVYSIDIKDKLFNDEEILNLIKVHNPKYKIKKIAKLSAFSLKSSNLRNYYYKNILAFGDLLHRIHPIAGQGFNMTIRDIKYLSQIIQDKIDLGIQLDTFVLDEFEKKTKSTNFLFSGGIDFIYEAFNFKKKNDKKNMYKILKFFGKNKNFMNSLIRLADKGLKA
jgi:2-octaprenyl-6-methoxyphenol hydroxylase